MSVGVAFKAFFAALVDRDKAQRIRSALEGISKPMPSVPSIETPPIEKRASETSKPEPTKASRSEALTLLSTLQREARFLDLAQESLDGFDDAQVGAAAREVLRDCRKTLDRMFAIVPLAEVDEGETLHVSGGASPHELRPTGASEGTGTVTHRGWKATCCQVPTWNGGKQEAWLLAPTEVEIG